MRGARGLVVAVGAVVALAAVSCVGGPAKPGASAPGAGWRGYRDPRGWTLRYPPDWRFQRVDTGGFRIGIRGALITNLAEGIPELRDPLNFSPSRWDMRHLPPSFVAIQFVHETFSGGPQVLACSPSTLCPSPTSEPDTPLPLSLGDARSGPDEDRDSLAGPPALGFRVVARGDSGYVLKAWFGAAVGARDREIAERIVASIAFAPPA